MEENTNCTLFDVLRLEKVPSITNLTPLCFSFPSEDMTSTPAMVSYCIMRLNTNRILK
jgi:hypothetical protein